MSQKSNNERSLDLIVDGNDVSHYVAPWATCTETVDEWTVHTELIPQEGTSHILQSLKDRNVQIKYRLRSKTIIAPWRSGSATLTWRLTEIGREELILHGIGRLNKDKSTTKTPSISMTAEVAEITLTDGRVRQGEKTTGIIAFGDGDPRQTAFREAQLRTVAENEIRAITDPEFLLFLAGSSLSSYRLLHDYGTSHQDICLQYFSIISLPLSVEYFLKYLLFKKAGTFKKEYRIHKLLDLFDFLPFDLQKSIDEEYKNELERIGMNRESKNIRIVLNGSQDVFTAFRYLFEPNNAKNSRHLLRPENITILTCVSDALERISGRI